MSSRPVPPRLDTLESVWYTMSHMEITTTTVNRSPARRAAVNALAFVGFIALLIIGIGLAIYAARYLPKLTSRIGGAGVSLSSLFHSDGDDDASLQVVTSTTTLPIIDTATTTATSSTAASKPAGTSHAAGAGVGGYTTVTTVTTTHVAPYGDPDLSVRITDVGYLRDDGETNTFVASSYVPDNKDGAVKFTVTNTGTNVTGSWKFEVDVPSSPSQTFTSPTQKSLNPGDSVDYVLGFEDGREGDNREITVTVDSHDDVDESNERNNEASRDIDIRG